MPVINESTFTHMGQISARDLSYGGFIAFGVVAAMVGTAVCVFLLTEMGGRR
jgi:hypothetical protein